MSDTPIDTTTINTYDLINDYTKFVETTAIFPADRGISYCLKKLCGEIGEAVEKSMKTHNRTFSDDFDLVRELGDVLWYTVALAREFDIPTVHISPINYGTDSAPPHTALHLIVFAGRISEAAGKIIRDRGGDDTNTSYLSHTDFGDAATVNIYNLLLTIMDVGISRGVTLDTIIAINKDKLLSRRSRGVIKGSGDNR